MSDRERTMSDVVVDVNDIVGELDVEDRAIVQGYLDRQHDEIERLRAALQELADSDGLAYERLDYSTDGTKWARALRRKAKAVLRGRQ